jgi:hypothetical protein
MHLLAVASVHGRPQGEILQAIHNWVISRGLLPDWWYQIFYSLLTREEVQLESIVKPSLISLTVNTEMAQGTFHNIDTPIWWLCRPARHGIRGAVLSDSEGDRCCV